MSGRWSPDDLAKVLARFGAGAVRQANVPPNTPQAKYGSQRVADTEGWVYASKLQLRYKQELDLERRAGTVLWFLEEVPFRLPGKIIYRADFLVIRPSRIDVVDCKGVITRTSLNKIKQVKALYGVTILLYRKDGSLRPFSER